jgi:hypothetical protein
MTERVVAMKGLTQRLVDNLKPPKKGSPIVWDGVIPGFGVRLTEKGVKSYILAYRVCFSRSRRLSRTRWNL